MSDDIKIGLDGKPLTDAAKPALDALRDLRLAAEALDKSDLSRARKSVQDLSSSVKQLSAAAEQEMKKFAEKVAAGIDQAAPAAKTKAKATGKSIGKLLAEGIEEEVSRAQVRISAPRMQLPNGLSASVGGKGLQSAREVLAESQRLMSENGARTTAQIASEAKARRELAKIEEDSSKLTFAARQSAYRWEQSAAKAISAEAAAAAKVAQADSNLTYRMRSSFVRAEQVEIRKSAALEAADAQRTFTFRNNFYKAEASALARNAKQEAADAALNFRMRSNYIKAESAQLAAAANERITVAGLKARAQVTQAMQNPAGAFSISRGQNTGTVVEMAQAAGAARNLSAESKALAASHREVHSAMRGVAGAGGALFLTYGSLIPLTTAFAGTTAVLGAIKAYKDLEYQIKFVKALEEEGSVGNNLSERSIRRQIVPAAVDAGYDPVEAGKGLRLLAQSGLSAQESLSALPTVLKLATVGELGVAEATETLTGAVHAFGLQMSDMGRVGDVLAKAGAISNTSVSKMSESMKQASTIAQQYGLEIEEVSTILVALAKRNITGSSAGTATANLFRELGTPHGKEAKQVAKDLGITLWDPLDKSRKDFFAKFIPELRKSLEPLDPESQAYVLNKLTNSRGEKALGAILGLTDEALAGVKTQLDTSTGFVEQANAKILDSVEGDMKRLKAAYTGALGEAGAGGSADLRAALQGLSEIVASPGFQDGLTALVSNVTALARVGVGAAGVLGTIYSWLEKIQSYTAAGAVLDALSQKMKDRSGTDAAVSAGNSYIASLDSQIAKVRQLVAEKSRLDGGAVPSGMAALRAARDAAEAKMKAAGPGTAVTAQHPGLRAAQENTRENLERNRAVKDYETAQAALLSAHTKNITLIKEQREYDASIASPPMQTNALGHGTTAYHAEPKTGAGAARRAANEDYKNEKKRIDLLVAGSKMLADIADADAKRDEASAQQSYDRGVISYQTYQQKLAAIQAEQSTVRINLAESERDTVKRGLADLTLKAAAKTKAGLPDAGDSLANDITAMTQTYLKAEQRVAELVDNQKRVQDKALTAALKPGSAILKDAELTGAADEEKVAVELEKLRIKGAGLELSDREQFVQAETLRILGDQEKKLTSYQEIFRKMRDEGAFSDIFTNPDTREVFTRLEGIIAGLQGGISGTKAKVADAAGQSFDGKEWESYGQKISSSVEGSVKEGLVGGLTGDYTSFSKLGETLKKTVVTALVDAFYSAFVKDSVNDLAKSLMQTLRMAISGAGDSGGSGISLGTVLGIASAAFGGGGGAGITSTAGAIGTGAAATSAIAGYGTGTISSGLGAGLGKLFSQGGFTGPGGKHDVAGLVHAGEFVINARNTARLPRSFLESLNGYAEGGLVGMTTGPTMTSSPAARLPESGGGGFVFSPTTTIQVDSRSDRAAVIQDVQRIVAEGHKQYTEQLKRIKVLPS